MIYCIEELDPALDSANMNMADWARIAKVINKYGLYQVTCKL